MQNAQAQSQRDPRVVTWERIPLEDEVGDILNKAQRGLQLTNEELADRAALSVNEVMQAKSGQSTAETLERLAFALNLHAASLQVMAEQKWYPKPVNTFTGFAMFTTFYKDMTVNAYLVWDPQTREAATFDTGSTCAPMLQAIETHQLELKRIFITHTHMDHLADLETLQDSTQATCYGSSVENPLGLKGLKHQDGLTLGSLRIRVLSTFGHTPGGLSYFIQGLAKPLVVVGDALFASSMGGAPYAYEDALRNNETRILALPEETIICPGHGPLTTVGEERQHNPFFPQLKSAR